jgi:glycosyltransferase involved in cell wall biosynthesis
MRVAHLTTVDSSLRFLLFPQLRAVVDTGGEAVGISAPGPWVEGLERDGIRHIALPSSTRGANLRADLRAARELWRILRRERLDVLHTHNPKTGVYGRILGRLAGVPIVVNTVHGLYATDRDPRLKRVVVYVLEAIAARFSNVELVQNAEDLELMLRWRITPRKRARLLGNGVDLTRFDPARFSDADRESTRRELGIGPGQIVVGTVGRLVAEKGYPELFDAMEALGDRYRLVAVGPEDPDKADALPRAMLDRAARDGICFLGQRDDVDRLYTAFDVFVLATHREGFPRAAMEAAAMGLPIVATDIRGCRQVVEDTATGFLVPVDDAGALSAAIARLGDDAELRDRFGAGGREFALRHFDERNVVRTVMESYHEVAARKGRASS